MFPVGENLILEWKIGTTGVNEVNAGKTIFESNFLSAEVFFDSERKISAAFDCGVVGDDHALATADATDAGDDTGSGSDSVVDVEAGEGGEFEEGGSIVK
jgi:hypothetical protein